VHAGAEGTRGPEADAPSPVLHGDHGGASAVV